MTVFSSSSKEAELTKKYYTKFLETSCKYMLKLIHDCRIRNFTYEDCIDMYNEFFTIAVQTYQPSLSRFSYYLRKIINYNTLSFIRRVISKHDPLFYSVSLDRPNEQGLIAKDLLGDFDYSIKNFEQILASPNIRTFNVNPLDKLILYYRGLGYSLREIGRMLNLSVSTVQRRIRDQRKNKKLIQSLTKLD